MRIYGFGSDRCTGVLVEVCGACQTAEGDFTV